MQSVDENLCLAYVAAQCGCFEPHRVRALAPAGRLDHGWNQHGTHLMNPIGRLGAPSVIARKVEKRATVRSAS